MKEQQPRIKGKFAVKGKEPLGNRISVRLYLSIEEKLRSEANCKGISSSQLIRKIVTDRYLERENIRI